MPSWDEVIGSVDKHPNGVLDIIRNNHIKMLAAKRGRNVICTTLDGCRTFREARTVP